MTKYKTCKKCGQIKADSDFVKSFDKKSNREYLSGKCRLCVNENLRLWQRENKDKVAKYARNYRANHPQKAMQNSQRAMEKRKEKPKPIPLPKTPEELQQAEIARLEKLSSKRQAKKKLDKQCGKCFSVLSRSHFNADRSRWDRLQPNCKKCTRAKSKAWSNANQIKISEYRGKRRALMNGADNRLVTGKDIQKLLSKPCAYCGAPSEHIDHIVPLVRGGRHSIGNLTGACKFCNLSKGSKFITEWRKGKHAA